MSTVTSFDSSMHVHVRMMAMRLHNHHSSWWLPATVTRRSEDADAQQ